MKIGIKKIHESEWVVSVGHAGIRLDQFSLALLDIALNHLLALEHGETDSTLKSYIKLGLKIKDLPDLECQKLLRALETKDILVFMMVAEDPSLNALMLKNIGAILAKQLELDLVRTPAPSEEHAKKAIRRIVEKTFELEALGNIEFTSEETRYI
ncbi:MAG: hypothetical protein ISEC1_P1552 [Thiomicrorhabdus sp.]|nr:MAG: hypothetical protein ISEC1_P1552 [Thiomicrorhabdus sp.]